MGALGLFHTCAKAAFICLGGHINTEFTPAAEEVQCCVAESKRIILQHSHSVEKVSNAAMNKKKITYLSTQNFAIKIFVKRHKHFIFSEFDFVATVYVTNK